MSAYKVEAIEVLKGKPREAEAKDIITRVAKQVSKGGREGGREGGWEGRGGGDVQSREGWSLWAVFGEHSRGKGHLKGMRVIKLCRPV